MIPTFKKGDIVKKGKRIGTVVYDSHHFNDSRGEQVQIYYDDAKNRNGLKWGSIKGVIKV